MRKFYALMAVFMMTLALGIVDAEAKRLGAGRSSGMQRSIEAPSRPATPAPAPAPATVPQSPNRGFGWGGALAGLAAGGLLGALLFGGAFDGIKPLDIVVLLGIALVIFMIMRAMRRRHEAQPMAYAGLGGGQQPNYAPNAQGVLEPQESYSPRGGVLSQRPAGFDEAEFLHSAKAAYNRLQAAWDAKDLNDLRRFTTPEMFGELGAQIQEMGEARNVTEVLSLDAQLLDITPEADRWIASVRYDGLIREDPQANPERVSEIWHFVKPVNSTNPTWYLAGIQQA